MLTHSGVTDTIWCYGVEHDGYTLDKRRLPTPEHNDLPDLMIKYGLRFASTLSAIRPSAFITSDEELQWDNIAPERQAYHYAKPLLGQDLLMPDTQIGSSVLCFKGTLAEPVMKPKNWEIRADQLDEHYTLLPGQYQPVLSVSSRPGFPPDSPIRAKPMKAQSFSVPGVYVPSIQNWVQLAAWYDEFLRALRALYRYGQVNAKQHVAALRLLAAIKYQLERHFCIPFQSPYWP